MYPEEEFLLKTVFWIKLKARLLNLQARSVLELSVEDFHSEATRVALRRRKIRRMLLLLINVVILNLNLLWVTERRFLKRKETRPPQMMEILNKWIILVSESLI